MSCAADDDDGGYEQPPDPTASAICGQYLVALSYCASGAEVGTWLDIHQAGLHQQNFHTVDCRRHTTSTL